MAPSTIITLDSVFGESGRDDDKTCFRMPRFLCALTNGNLCISDTMNQRLQIVQPDGTFVKTIGAVGTGPGMLRGPSGVVCDGSCLYVCEAGNHRVQKLKLGMGGKNKSEPGSPLAGSPASGAEPVTTGEAAAAISWKEAAAAAVAAAAGGPPMGDAASETKADGAPLGRAGHHGAQKPTDLWCPQGICISKRFSTEVKELFVADSINGRVAVYDAGSMEHIRTFGERGEGEGQLLYPSGIAAPLEEVFVAELGNHRVSVFSKK